LLGFDWSGRRDSNPGYSRVFLRNSGMCPKMCPIERQVYLRRQKAAVSATLARVPNGLKYVFTVPVCVSVTVIVYSTFESAP
jgi:hypothetical protein